MAIVKFNADGLRKRDSALLEVEHKDVIAEEVEAK